jgi:hypothetical protein
MAWSFEEQYQIRMPQTQLASLTPRSLRVSRNTDAESDAQHLKDGEELRK